MSTAEDILEQAGRLDDEKRIDIALRLLDSVGAPDPLGHLDDDEWLAEIERRAHRAASGETKGIPWNEVKAHVRGKLGRP